MSLDVAVMRFGILVEQSVKSVALISLDFIILIIVIFINKYKLVWSLVTVFYKLPFSLLHCKMKILCDFNHFSESVNISQNDLLTQRVTSGLQKCQKAAKIQNCTIKL